MLKPWQALFCVVILLSLSMVHSSFADTAIFSPRQQIKNGILPEDVLCSKNFLRFEKLSDQSLLCVKSTTAYVLSKRGWGILATQEISMDQAITKMNGYGTQHPNCINCSASLSRINFVFLKHDGGKDVPNFILYQSDDNSKIVGKEVQKISFIQSNETGIKWNQSEYYSNYTGDKYAWASYMYEVKLTKMIFVDPLTGEIIGYYNYGCHECT